jgi:hypothetical protein
MVSADKYLWCEQATRNIRSCDAVSVPVYTRISDRMKRNVITYRGLIEPFEIVSKLKVFREKVRTKFD